MLDSSRWNWCSFLQTCLHMDAAAAPLCPPVHAPAPHCPWAHLILLWLPCLTLPGQGCPSLCPQLCQVCEASSGLRSPGRRPRLQPLPRAPQPSSLIMLMCTIVMVPSFSLESLANRIEPQSQSLGFFSSACTCVRTYRPDDCGLLPWPLSPAVCFSAETSRPFSGLLWEPRGAMVTRLAQCQVYGKPLINISFYYFPQSLDVSIL